MGLQVRVRHALGERLVDLTDRPVERPLVVGRSREADLKIPSVTVASEHCVLFVHNRQWVLQDTSGGATYVNGTIIQGPTPLCVGDVVVLGADASPASIEVDPAGVAQGRSGHPAETHDPVPVTRAAPAPARVAASQYNQYESAPAASAYASPAVAPPAPLDAWMNQPAAQDDPFAGWQPASAESSGAPIRRRRRQTSQAPMFIGIAVCAVIVIGVIIVAVSHGFSDRVNKTVIVEEGPPKPKSNNIFGIGPDGSVEGTTDTRQQPVARKTSADSSPPPPAPTPAPPPEPAPAPAPAPAAAPSPPANQTPTPAPSPSPAPAPAADATPSSANEAPVDEKDWTDVQAAYDGPNQGIFILKSEDYRRQHPNSATKRLDAMVDTALDRIWWSRITDLCEKQSAVNSDLKKKDKDIREETSSAFKKTLMDERKELEAKLTEVQRFLNGDMGYTSRETPKIDDKELMQRLTAERDKDKYASWKQSTLRYIRQHHGSMPWDG